MLLRSVQLPVLGGTKTDKNQRKQTQFQALTKIICAHIDGRYPQPGLDRRIIDELATGRFLHEGRNLVLLGPPGVGKTHLAIGLGIRIASTSRPPWTWPCG